jgi:hypothetical protein
MFKIVNEIKSKKIYHFFKENKFNSVLFIFEDEIHFKVCNKLIDILKEKFTNVKFAILYSNPTKPGLFINKINLNQITASNLKSRYDIVFIIPYELDEYNMNNEIFGLPISIERSINNQDNLVNYYNVGNFILFSLDEIVAYNKIAEIIDDIKMDYSFSSVLIGNSISIAEVCNLTKTNPIAIYNNVYLSSQFLKLAFLVVDGFMVSDEVYIINYIVNSQDKLEDNKEV